MDLTARQRAALTSALPHPRYAITAAPETTVALQRRGLVVGKLLTERGIEIAEALDGAFLDCAVCGKPYRSMRTLPTTGRDICAACAKRLCADVAKTGSINERRAEWTRKGARLKELQDSGHFGPKRRFEH